MSWCRYRSWRRNWCIRAKGSVYKQKSWVFSFHMPVHMQTLYFNFLILIRSFRTSISHDETQDLFKRHWMALPAMVYCYPCYIHCQYQLITGMKMTQSKPEIKLSSFEDYSKEPTSLTKSLPKPCNEPSWYDLLTLVALSCELDAEL